MANPISTLERLSASAPVLKLMPMLLAAVLIGCSTKSQRIGSLSGDPSMVTSANSKGRGVPPDAASPGAASGVAKSQGDKAPAEAGAQGSNTVDSEGGGTDRGSNGAGASSSSDDVGGVAPSGRDGTGGDQASSLAGGTADVAGRDAKGNTAAPGRPGSARGARPGPNAGAGGSSKPGAASGGDDASSPAGESAAADGEHAGAGDSSALEASGADLSSGGAVAGLESDAAGGPAGRKRAPSAKRRAGPGQGEAAGEARNIAGTDDDRSGTSGAAAAGVEGDSRIAAIDVPSGSVKVDEEYRPQTLGGVLPLVLGVNEEGRFDFDQYSLRPDVKRILDELADKLKTAEYDRLDIIGYTDRIGSTDYNRRLSELRAYAVAQYLMGKGVPENKIHYEGRGEKSPLTPSGECQGLAREELITCLQKDRRVEIEASIHRKHATVVQ